MSKGVRCDSCRAEYIVDDDVSGSSMECLACGSQITIAGVGTEKICTVCKIDLRSIPRTKDPHGNYYCRECYAVMQSTVGRFSSDARELRQAILEDRQRQQPATAGAESQPFDSELERFMTRLSTEHFSVRAKSWILALTSVLVAGAFLSRPIGIIAAAIALVSGLLLLGFVIVWVLVLPFRDGPGMGFSCLLKSYRRREWLRRNHDPRQRPGRLARFAIGLLALYGLFHLAVWIGEDRPLPTKSLPASQPHQGVAGAAAAATGAGEATAGAAIGLGAAGLAAGLSEVFNSG